MKKYVVTALTVLLSVYCFSQNYSDLLYRDWASLRAYANVNASMGDERPDVVFMGNSITEGWFNQHPDFFVKNNFAGRGIGGQTSSEMLVRFRQDVINLQPGCVAILAGTNDIAMNNGYISLENTFQNIQSMCELAKFNGIKVLLCSVPPCASFPWRKQIKPANLIVELNKSLKAYADITEGIDYVDYYTALVDENKGLSGRYSPEGCHPNSAGYSVMEKIIVKALNQVNDSKVSYYTYGE